MGEFVDSHDVSLTAISQRLAVVKDAGLLEQNREGRVRRCVFRGKPLPEASSRVDQYRIFREDTLESFSLQVEVDD